VNALDFGVTVKADRQGVADFVDARDDMVESNPKAAASSAYAAVPMTICQ
jgi:hypothetical protein